MLDAIKSDYFSGKIKTQNLEQEVFVKVCNGDPAKVKDACRIAAEIRCDFLESKTGKNLSQIKNAHIDTCGLKDTAILSGIESKIGGAILPMGFAGPAKICGQYVSPEEDIYIPLATNEAALVAGVQRGLKAIALGGGLKTLVHYDAMTRAPLIEAPDIYTARKFIDFATGNSQYIAELQKCIPDPFVRLEDIEFYQLGTKVFLRLIFKTGDAMGMNGATKAAAEICRYILAKNPEWRLLTISGNMCTDKKNSHINVLNGRGKSVQT